MESSLLPARVNDTISLCERTDTPRFLGFLSESEAAVAASVLKTKNARFEFSGGHEDAERQMLCCKPEWCENPDYPITAITFSYRECDTLAHKDFLGSLMALGITRESVGDILVEKGRTVIFVLSEISDYIISQISKVGRIGVTVKSGADLPLPQSGEKVELKTTVASMRLDCVVSALAGISRGKASEYIESGLVSVNSFVCEKATMQLKDGDRLSVRGHGKFFIGECQNRSRKDRIILDYSKFI